MLGLTQDAMLLYMLAVILLLASLGSATSSVSVVTQVVTSTKTPTITLTSTTLVYTDPSGVHVTTTLPFTSTLAQVVATSSASSVSATATPPSTSSTQQGVPTGLAGANTTSTSPPSPKHDSNQTKILAGFLGTLGGIILVLTAFGAWKCNSRRKKALADAQPNRELTERPIRPVISNPIPIENPSALPFAHLRPPPGHESWRVGSPQSQLMTPASSVRNESPAPPIPARHPGRASTFYADSVRPGSPQSDVTTDSERFTPRDPWAKPENTDSLHGGSGAKISSPDIALEPRMTTNPPSIQYGGTHGEGSGTQPSSEYANNRLAPPESQDRRFSVLSDNASMYTADYTATAQANPGRSKFADDDETDPILKQLHRDLALSKLHGHGPPYIDYPGRGYGSGV